MNDFSFVQNINTGFIAVRHEEISFISPEGIVLILRIDGVEARGIPHLLIC